MELCLSSSVRHSNWFPNPETRTSNYHILLIWKHSRQKREVPRLQLNLEPIWYFASPGTMKWPCTWIDFKPITFSLRIPHFLSQAIYLLSNQRKETRISNPRHSKQVKVKCKTLAVPNPLWQGREEGSCYSSIWFLIQWFAVQSLLKKKN